MIFADASALVAILKREPEADALAQRLAEAEEIWVSALVRFEVVASMAASLARSTGRTAAGPGDFEAAGDLLADLLRDVGARDLDLTPEIGERALAAARAYGKVAGHPARLNMGDCFAHACAKALGAPLLYKGEDFAQTDLA